MQPVRRDRVVASSGRSSGMSLEFVPNFLMTIPARRHDAVCPYGFLRTVMGLFQFELGRQRKHQRPDTNRGIQPLWARATSQKSETQRSTVGLDAVRVTDSQRRVRIALVFRMPCPAPARRFLSLGSLSATRPPTLVGEARPSGCLPSRLASYEACYNRASRISAFR